MDLNLFFFFLYPLLILSMRLEEIIITEFFFFKVLEVSWKNLSEQLDNSKDMDDVISANEHFLDTIISQLLLDENSKV